MIEDPDLILKIGEKLAQDVKDILEKNPTSVCHL